MKICFFTGSRAEYGLIKDIFKELKKKNFHVDLVVSGSHFLREYGLSYKEILSDNIKISKSIRINLKRTTSYDITKMFAKTVEKINLYLKKKKFDLFVVVGDRYETFAASIAAYINNIPICHFHGGELSFNSLDDNFRHSISKLSKIHFVAHKNYKKRLLQLGENKNNIIISGGLGADAIKKVEIYSKDKLKEILKISKVYKKLIVVNYYPEIHTLKKSEESLTSIFKTILYFKNVCFVFTLPSIDTNVDIFKKKIIDFSLNNQNCKVFANLGQKKYFSLLNSSNLMLGNSSSGILEMPSFAKYTLNIGERQKGRIFPKSVIQTEPNPKSLIKNITKYIDKISRFKNPFYKSNTIRIIMNKFIQMKKNRNLLNNYKEFLDIK